MALFGLPGGAEFVVILLLALLVFGPYALVGWFAYHLGLDKGREQAERIEPVREAEPKSESAGKPTQVPERGGDPTDEDVE